MMKQNRFKCNFLFLFLMTALFLAFIVQTAAKAAVDADFKNSSMVEKPLTVHEIRGNKGRYLTVGKKYCDFKTIKEALKKVTKNRNVICIMDRFHVESGISLNKNVSIIGFGKNTSAVGAAHPGTEYAGRIFMIEKNTKVSIKWLKICNGYVRDVPRCGAGVYNKGILMLTNCEISGNMATYGIGINNEGLLYMDDCSVLKNIGMKRPVKDNLTGLDCGGSGAGIKCEKDSKAYISRCLISKNESVANGGGIHISCEGYLSMINCTIVGNTAQMQGGGICDRGKLDMTHCTVFENIARLGDGLVITGEANLTSNILSGNGNVDVSLGVGSTYSRSGKIGINQFNLFGKSTIKAYKTGKSGLLPLSKNGGETETCALSDSSQAINAVPPNKTFSKQDQRGMIRKDSHADLGAFER